MQEGSVTVAQQTYRLDEPFFVMATQNPLEMEGTYPLPEAQLDRFFFKVNVDMPNVSEMVEIMDRTTGKETPAASKVVSGAEILQMRELARGVPLASHVKEFVARLVLATHPEDPNASSLTKKYVRYGVSPRGAQALSLGAKVTALFSGKFNVSFEDIKAVAPAALRHRLLLNFDGLAEGVKTDDVIAELLNELQPQTG
jgi:MoxR-like ATPase